jgi:hypothetical protein
MILHRKPRDAAPAVVLEHIAGIVRQSLDRACNAPAETRLAVYAAALMRIRATLPEESRP